MKVKVASVQTESYWGEEEHRNAKRALEYVEEAARAGAQLICFPEGYPGPCHGAMDEPLSHEPIEAMCGAAKRYGVFISASEIEDYEPIPGTFYLTHKLISPKGEILANYARCQPDHPPLNEYLMNGRKHIIPGEDITVVDTEIGKIGLQICSELFVPEIARIQMLKGAQIILSPINGAHSQFPSRIRDTWQCIARARAAENLLHLVVAGNVFIANGRRFDLGAGCICSPEDFLARADGPGIIYGTLDLDRLEWLRENDVAWELLKGSPEDGPYSRKTRAGQIYDRRPELYQKLVEPQPDAWNYFYFQNGLDTWDSQYRDGKKIDRQI